MHNKNKIKRYKKHNLIFNGFHLNKQEDLWGIRSLTLNEFYFFNKQEDPGIKSLVLNL